MTAITDEPRPIPPRYGWITFQTPKEPWRNLWPIPSSRSKRGIPSRIIIIRNGKINAPKRKRIFTKAFLRSQRSTHHIYF